MIPKLVTILFLSGDPISIPILATLVETTPEEIEKQVSGLKAALESIGLTLLRSTEGLSIVTQSLYAPFVEAFWKEELQGDLTPASLQVLTLVAYLGSPTREQISYIRGVQSSVSIRTLTVRGLITRSGEVCTITGEALKQLGVTISDELPQYEIIRAQLVSKLETKEV
jgi:segregation and condensation protein B